MAIQSHGQDDAKAVATELSNCCIHWSLCVHNSQVYQERLLIGTMHYMPESDTWSPTVPSQVKCHGVAIVQGYSTLLSNTIHFIYLDEMLVPINTGCLDEVSSFEATLLEHKAKWHKSWYSKFSTMKLQQAEKAAIGYSDIECPSYCQKVHPHKRLS